MSIFYLYNNDSLVEWAQKRIRNNRFRPDAQAMGIEINGVVRAVTVWDNFSPRSCFISVASDGKPNWLNQEFAIRSMAFPFVQCHFARLSALVSILNEPSLKFVQRMGFTYEGTVREGGFENENLILFGLLRRECRWLTAEQRQPALLDQAIAV